MLRREPALRSNQHAAVRAATAARLSVPSAGAVSIRSMVMRMLSKAGLRTRPFAFLHSDGKSYEVAGRPAAKERRIGQLVSAARV